MVYKPVGADENGKFPPRVEAALDATFASVIWAESAAFATPQAALNTAVAGSTVLFTESHTITAPYTVPASGVTVRAARGVTITQTTWAAPGFDLLGVDDVTIDGFTFRYTGARGGIGSAFRGESGYGYAAGVWANGNRIVVSNVRVVDMAVGVALSAWNGTTNAAGHTGNAVTNLTVEGVNFGVLWAGQSGLTITNLAARNLRDDSSGANPIHAFYGSGQATLRSTNVTITNVTTDGCGFGNAFQAKYVDGLVFRGGIAERSEGLANFHDCTSADVSGLVYRNGVPPTGPRGLIAIFSIQQSTTRSTKFSASDVRIDATKSGGTTENPVIIVADDSNFRGFHITTNRSTVGDGPDVQVIGNRTTVDGFTIENKGSAGRSFMLGSYSLGSVSDLTLKGFRTTNSRQYVDVITDSTGVLIEYNPSDQRTPATPANSYIGSVGTGTAPAYVVNTAGMAGAPARAGLYYGPEGAASQSPAATGLDIVRAVPVLLARAVTVDRIVAEVTTAAAGSTVRLGIYADAGGYPGRLIAEGTADGAVIGVKEVTLSARVPAGLCWLAAVTQGGAPTMRTTAQHSRFVGTAVFSSGIVACFTSSGITGALPAVFPAGTTTGGVAAYIQIRTQH